MNRTEWEATVTRLVDEAAGPLFGWNDVTVSEWDALWTRRLTPEEAAHALMCEAPPSTGRSIVGDGQRLPPE